MRHNSFGIAIATGAASEISSDARAMSQTPPTPTWLLHANQVLQRLAEAGHDVVRPQMHEVVLVILHAQHQHVLQHVVTHVQVLCIITPSHSHVRSLGVHKGLDGDVCGLLGRNHAEGLIHVEQTLADVSVLGLRQEVIVHVALRLVADAQLARLRRLVLQITKVDIRLAELHVRGTVALLRLLQLALDAQLGLLQLGSVVVLHLHIHHGEHGLVVRPAQLHDVVIALHLNGVRVDALACLVQNTIAPRGSAALLALLLVVIGCVLFVFVGRRELDIWLRELVERQTRTLRDLQLRLTAHTQPYLILLQQKLIVVRHVLKHLQRWNVRGDTIVQIADLHHMFPPSLPRTPGHGSECRKSPRPRCSS